MKRCGKCGERKPESEFTKRSDRGGRPRSPCKSCDNARSKIYCAANRKQQRVRSKKYSVCLRAEVQAAYGGKCVCCGEDRHEFLTIDHVNGGGSEHRRRMGSKTYRWLKKYKFPKEGFRLLCSNCNNALGLFGYCPHEWELVVGVPNPPPVLEMEGGELR